MSEDRIKEKIAKLKEHTSMEYLDEVVEALKEEPVWIPASAVTDEEDDRKIMQMIEDAGEDTDSLVGREYTSEAGIHLIPKLIQGGEHMYLPVFSSTDEMIEDSETSEVQSTIFEAIALAMNCDQQLRGIVVNPFTQGFIIDYDLLKAFEEEKDTPVS